MTIFLKWNIEPRAHSANHVSTTWLLRLLLLVRSILIEEGGSWSFVLFQLIRDITAIYFKPSPGPPRRAGVRAVVPSLGVYIYKFNVSVFRMISISATYRLIMPDEDYLYFVLRHDNALQSIALPHLLRGNGVCDKIQAIRVPITLSV